MLPRTEAGDSTMLTPVEWVQLHLEIVLTLVLMMPLECCWIFFVGFIAGRVSKDKT